MARKTAEEAQRTRQKILASGAQVFAASGFACATLDMIAKQAELSRGAVYWHFKGKEELLEVILQDTTLPIEDFFSAGVDLQRNIQRLHVAIEQTLTNIDSRQLCEILLKKSENLSTAAPITERLHQAQGNFTSQMQQLLHSAISSGELDPKLDINATCRLFQVCLSGLFFECLQGNLDVHNHLKNTFDVIGNVLLKHRSHLLTVGTTSGCRDKYQRVVHYG
jgi:AcrR family transcriptional regulator